MNGQTLVNLSSIGNTSSGKMKSITLPTDDVGQRVKHVSRSKQFLRKVCFFKMKHRDTNEIKMPRKMKEEKEDALEKFRSEHKGCSPWASGTALSGVQKLAPPDSLSEFIQEGPSIWYPYEVHFAEFDSENCKDE